MKNKLKNILQLLNPNCIVLITNERFVIIYDDILCEAYHGEFNSKSIYVYNSKIGQRYIKNDLEKCFPELVIIVM